MAEVNVAELVARLRADVSDFQRGMAQADDSARTTFDKIQSHAARMGDVGRALTYGLTLPILGLFAVGISEAKEAAAVAAQTEAVIRSTGGAAQVTAEDVRLLSERVARKAAMDDEAIQSGANLLLTFKNIRNEAGEGNRIFDRSVGMAADLSRAWGQDMKSSAIQLGKALEDPIGGISALRRVGIQFTDAQEAMIRSMVEAGDVLGAQKLILKELETQVGGSAKAYGETLGGQVDRARESFRNATAELATAAIPALSWLADTIAGAVKWFQGLSPGVKEAIAVIALLVAAVGPLLIALSAIVAHPVILAILAIIAAGYLLITNWDEIRAAFVSVWEWMKAAATDVRDWIVGALTSILDFFKALPGNILDGLKALPGLLLALAISAIQLFLDGLVAQMKLVVSFVAGVPGMIVAAISTIGNLLWDLGRWAFNSLLGGLHEAWQALWGFVSGIPGAILGLLAGLANQMWSVGAWILNSLLGGIHEAWGALWSFLSGIPGAIWNIMSGIPGQLWDLGRSAASSFWNGFKSILPSLPSIPDLTPWNGLLPDLNPFGAEGAIVRQPTRALIGERGPEMLIPLNRMPGASPLPSDLGGGGNTYQITVLAWDTQDGGEAAVEAIREYERRSGAGWRN